MSDGNISEEKYCEELETCALQVAAGFVMKADDYTYLPQTLFLAGLMCSVDVVSEKMSEDEITTARRISEQLKGRLDEFLPEPDTGWFGK